MVELFIKTGVPVGSQALKESGFDSLSSATLRNYFCNLEKEGFLTQQHSSGGRIPTPKAFRKYANTFLHQGTVTEKEQRFLAQKMKKEKREIGRFLHEACEVLSEISQCAVFLSHPRFDQDFIQNVKIVFMDNHQLLCILFTDFGLIRSEILYSQKELIVDQIPLIEAFFLFRLNKGKKPSFPDESEAKNACRLYNEAMVRHVVGYSNFPSEDLFRTGLSTLLSYPELQKPALLAQSLSLFEDQEQMRSLLRESMQRNELLSWIGEELFPSSNCSILACPFSIHQIPVGAIALLGPLRLPYRRLFGLLRLACESISESLTKSIYKFKISFREPSRYSGTPFIRESSSILLENKSKHP